MPRQRYVEDHVLSASPAMPPLESAKRDASRRLVVLLLVAHLAGCLWYFPPREIFSGEPLLTSDYVFHYLEASRVASYLRQGSFLGYCTTWAAGFPDGFLGMINSKPFSLALAISPSAAWPLVFNLLVLLMLWSFAAWVYAAARRFGREPGEAAVATGLALLAWYGSSLFRTFWRGGSVLFVTGSAFAFWALGCLHRLWGVERTTRTFWTTLAAAAMVPWVHPGAYLVVVLGGALLYVATFRERGLRLVELAAIGSVTVATNLPWLWPFVRYGDLRRGIAYPIYQGGIDQLVADLVRAPFHLGFYPGVETAVLLPLLGTLPLARRAWRDQPLVPSVLIPLAAVLAAMAYAGGAFSPLAALQPYRFVIPLTLVLAVLGAPGVRLLASPTRTNVSVVVALLVILLFADRIRVASQRGDYLGSGLGRMERSALAALRSVAAPDGRRVEGRVLLEGDWVSESLSERSGSKRVSYAFVGFERELSAEFIGAPLMTATTQEEVASFWRGKLFGRDFLDYDRESFLRLCDLYDVRWVVSLYEGTRGKLESFGPEVELVATSDRVAVFRVERRPQPLLRGAGSAASDGQRIVFSAPEAQPAVLKYHWNRLLVAWPVAEIRAASVMGVSPVGFIEMVPPRPGSYTIGMTTVRSRLDGD